MFICILDVECRNTQDSCTAERGLVFSAFASSIISKKLEVKNMKNLHTMKNNEEMHELARRIALYRAMARAMSLT